MSGNKGCLINETGITTFFWNENEEFKEEALSYCMLWFLFDEIVIDRYTDVGLAFKFIFNYHPFYPSEDPRTYVRTSGIFGTNNVRALTKIEVLLNDILKKNTVLRMHSWYFDVLINTEYYEILLKNLEKYKNKYSDKFFVIFYNYYFYKVKALIGLNNFEEASNTLDVYYDYCVKKNIPKDVELLELSGKVYLESGSYSEAVSSFSRCLTVNNLDDDLLALYNSGLKESYNLLLENFSSVPQEQRRFLFVTDDLHYVGRDDIIVLKKNNLPKSINFPLSHPKLNEVYVNHPINKDNYLLVDDYEKSLFIDKLREFQVLMDSLGAKKIDVFNKTKSIENDSFNSRKSYDGGIKVKGNGVEGGYSKSNSEDYQLEQELNIGFHQELRPKNMPFIPDNLVWYHSDLNWQRLVQQRMNGSLVKHKEIISAKEIESLSTQELTSVYAEIDILFVKLNFEYNKSSSYRSKRELNYTLEFHVEFEDFDNLKGTKASTEKIVDSNIRNKPLSNNDNLEKYKEDVLFMLEDDGVIDDVERKLLNRKIKHYGLTPSEALQIEEELMFNEGELNYIEEFKMLLEEGSIGDIERKMLNRYAKRYNLNSDRQTVLELSVTK